MSNENAVFDCVRELYSLHEERVYTYKLLEEGHKIYLSTAPNYDFARFRRLVHDVTAEFKRISDSIIAIEKKLRLNADSAAIADIIHNLQEDEKLKLKLTAKMQLAKQEFVDCKSDAKWEEVNAIKHQLNTVVENINGHLSDIRNEMDSY
ncbi:fed tick salivary protein 6-like protein [Dinothrombium tinctorium]|uniref:Fed tick salivary protein 6-like protein n=1 Tax=Dinothrombium tinctorium TaxID=1965070 RepID=A0A3S4QK00_9ACAR|nr:fed tick salivary protein 6-like protein [Dinothrombium tinctorium]